MKNTRSILFAALVLIWASLAACAWFGPDHEISEAERRPLDQMPKISKETILNGEFMAVFEDYTLDQFPLRDSFRKIKAVTHYYVMGQKDNNEIYVAKGHLAEMEYPLNTESVDHAMQRYQELYNLCLKRFGCNVYTTVVPDKGYYLAEENGYLSLDYAQMFSQVQAATPWAEFIDITDCLTLEDYYYTDTHWRQEKLLTVAQKLSQTMGGIGPKAEDFTQTELDRPFYGVYYGQAALPVKAEPMYIMESDLLKECSVFSYTTNKTTSVYDMEKLNGKDQYEVYLSGSESFLEIKNPNATSGKTLVIVRDSFGSSLAPLLVQDYERIILVDIRYMDVKMAALNLMKMGIYNADVLFMYSSLVLNKALI